MDRALVTIRKIDAINPIEGADKIDVATIGGWKVVIGKGQFNPGDIAVFFEVDCIIKPAPRYEFLNKSCMRLYEGFEVLRLRTVRLRGQLSQGLLMSLSEFTEEFKSIPKYMNMEGLDVTELLGVRKYEPPIPACLSGKAKGNFPSFIRKTDEERIQNVVKYFEWYGDAEFEVSVKMDGSSCTYYIKDREFGVCSRNIDLLETEGNTYWKVARDKKIEEKMRYLVDNSSDIVRSFALQGEVCGKSINGNREELEGQNFFLFNIFDIDKHQYLGYNMRKMVLEMLNMCEPQVKIEHVPVLGVFPVLKQYPTMAQLLAYAEGNGYKNDCREGIVCKSADGATSFKAISNKYLLKHGE
jgi:RNA ligase (TIGR02306 family)